ncbi:DUF1236 domain-containing protein [Microvirga sp. ACRRW]|uniref:DUF1236 domain-containing protein n=1 Tax=Microvirga sp. ACRRW TaxID=2918205 RepID=UPI001EF5A329|nr:DUF1236 domain-containing protein [Microvirga sp. ACRRW]MCG7393248.1 DUF1236 domain-containing protein [Microvirga sp. ACRRW]
MRVALLTTVAAAAFSLSVAAIAQTSSGSGTTGGASGGAAGSVSGGASGGASGAMPGTTSGGVPKVNPDAASGGASSATTGSTSSGMQSGTTGSKTGNTSGGAAAGAATSGATTGTSSTTGHAPNTTGSTASSTSINVTGEQRTEITRAFRSVDARPINNVNFTVSVGAVVPQTVVTELHACPSEVVRILAGLPECRYVIIRDQVVIVEPKTRKIVTVIEHRG